MILMGGVALLLLLACANVANLLLGPTGARSSELMIRTALGARRARLTLQLLTEALVLSLVATVAGLLVAHWTSALATAHGEPATLIGRMVTAEGSPGLRIVGVVRGMLYSGPAYESHPQIFRVSRASRALTIVAASRAVRVIASGSFATLP